MPGLPSFTAPDRRSRPPIPCADQMTRPGHPPGRVFLWGHQTTDQVATKQGRLSQASTGPLSTAANGTGRDVALLLRHEDKAHDHHQHDATKRYGGTKRSSFDSSDA
jgi:hypothetical protein